MNNKVNMAVIILSLVIAITAIAGFFYSSYKSESSTICTLETKLCFDGSYVSRQGPNCEFAQCPDIIKLGVIKGKVIIGPICPVERAGFPCSVPSEVYTSREIILYDSNKTTIIKRMNFESDGTYFLKVPSGTYVIDILKQGIDNSKDLPKTITIKSGQTVEFDFLIDTGIR